MDFDREFEDFQHVWRQSQRDLRALITGVAATVGQLAGVTENQGKSIIRLAKIARTQNSRLDRLENRG